MAVEVAAEENIVLVMENDFECNLGSGELAARLIQEIDSPHLALLWDCGNSFFVGEEAYPTGYGWARNVVGHVHVKDAAPDSETGQPHWVALGTGQVDILGQLQALRDDGYSGVVSMENHFAPDGGTPEDGVRQSFAGLQSLMARI
jgi:sugar phosphate isomerase/epimerase